MNPCKISHCNGLSNILSSNVNYLYFNARSLRKNYNEIETFLNCSKTTFHLLVITETWLYSNEVDYYNFKDYQAFHSTREISRGGGVAIYVHKNYDKANEIGKKSWNGNNCVVIELLNEKKKISVFYRQPNALTDPSGSIFVDELSNFLSNFTDIFFFGDFNFNLFESSRVIEKYKDCVSLNNCVFLNSFSCDFPTRINYTNKTCSCIDHIFTDQYDNALIDKFNVSYFDLVADHKALCLSLWLNQNNSTPIKKDFFTYAIVNHKQISANNLLENLASNDLSELVRDIKKIIENNSITCTLTNNIRKPYIDKETFKFIQIKRNYEKLKIKYPKSTYLHNKWKQYRNKLSNLCRHAKEKFLSCFFINNCTNSRKVWCQMNNCLGKSPKREYEAVSMLNENGITITDKKLISNILNAHQIDVSKKIILDSNVSKDEVINYHAFDFVDISTPFSCPQCTEDEIEQIINKLKPSNAIDIYGMSNNFLKIHRDELTKILNVLINKHMFNGDFPDALKFAVVKPIYKKKGSKLDKDNYRPISILPIVSKIYESVIYRRIYTHCKNNKYFNEEQFGYQEKSNPETAMIHTLNDIYKKIDSKLVTALLTIDLSKAFDCINHEILLSKLTKLQFPAFFIKLLKSYLENRYQAVKIDDILSDPLLIICGTPQGGVLSGLFFNIYVNSIFNLLLSSVLRLYCDDMSLIASGTSKETLKVNLEHDLFLINKWLSLHYLKANYSKTQYVLFSGRKKI